ncbi:MAG: ComEC/Rec2 family competence protein [Candidatus Obscuribacter phosphatis]|uniref:ComEC/Rec2 family competence protein n=1 Tax=Candidatus Obscuribacter phosphatis TaxID=1906157 RepID=A0A8J7PMG7_9BACT|nr:ComEC/Rec2 family competence protein [Candidatus Obscuribacter phosphatis]
MTSVQKSTEGWWFNDHPRSDPVSIEECHFSSLLYVSALAALLSALCLNLPLNVRILAYSILFAFGVVCSLLSKSLRAPVVVALLCFALLALVGQSKLDQGLAEAAGGELNRGERAVFSGFLSLSPGSQLWQLEDASLILPSGEVSSKMRHWQTTLHLAKDFSAEHTLQPGRFAVFCGNAYPSWQSRRLSLYNARLSSSSSLSSTSLYYEQFFAELRGKLATFHSQAMGKEAGSLLGSLVLGERASPISADLKLCFTQCGLSHLLAASGMNLTVVVAFAVFLSRGSKFAWFRPTVSLFSILLFSSLAGASPSVLRASCMCLLALFFSLFSGVRVPGLKTLALTVLLFLFIDPLAVFDVGLQLSLAATYGILTLVPCMEALLAEFVGQRQSLRKLVSLLAVILSAQVAVLPLQLYYFGTVNPIFLPANLLAEPLVVPLTILGFLSTLMALPFSALSLTESPLIFPSLALDWLSLPLVQLLALITRWLAGNFPSLVLEKPQALHLLIYYLLLFQIVLLKGRFASVKFARLALLSVLLAFLFAAHFYIKSPIFELAFNSKGFVVRRSGGAVYYHFSSENGALSRYLQRLPEKKIEVSLAKPAEPTSSNYDLNFAKDRLLIRVLQDQDGRNYLFQFFPADSGALGAEAPLLTLRRVGVRSYLLEGRLSLPILPLVVLRGQVQTHGGLTFCRLGL